jgi:hypothetical protein
MQTTNLWWWIVFNAGVLAMLAIDLFGFNRKAHAPATKEAVDIGKNPITRMARRFLPVTDDYHAERFSVQLNGRRLFRSAS